MTLPGLGESRVRTGVRVHLPGLRESRGKDWVRVHLLGLGESRGKDWGLGFRLARHHDNSLLRWVQPLERPFPHPWGGHRSDHMGCGNARNCLAWPWLTHAARLCIPEWRVPRGKWDSECQSGARLIKI